MTPMEIAAQLLDVARQVENADNVHTRGIVAEKIRKFALELRAIALA